MKIVFEKKPTKHGKDLFWNGLTLLIATVLMIVTAIWTSKENQSYEEYPYRMMTNFRIAILTFVVIEALLVISKILFVTIKDFKPSAVTIIRLVVQILAIINLITALVELAGDTWSWNYRDLLGTRSCMYLSIVFAYSLISMGLTCKKPIESK